MYKINKVNNKILVFNYNIIYNIKQGGNKMQNKSNKIKNIISIVIILVVLFVGYKIYKKYNFYDYSKAEYNLGISNFERDNNVKYTKFDSYKIENTDYNDAIFYKSIDVIPNTPYKVTCKIKTENVKAKNENTDCGAHICIMESLEKSDNVEGTTDWTEITFYFNSKNRTSVDLGFRLGGYEDSCIGTAWFSDFKIESGIADETNTWNFLCLIFDYLDVNIEKNGVSQNVKLRLTQTDKDDINICMRRFQNSMQELSKGKMKVKYDIEEITTPITSLSYDKENGYYVSSYNIKEIIDPYIKEGNYDHIFIAFRTGDINQKGAIPINDWIGLGSMEYRGIGFSNIRLPDDDNNYIYKYDVRVNTFPEEVFVHEFLHTLERNAEEYNYERPELHDNAKYGYENKKMTGLKDWYEDYMNKSINSSAGEIGLPQEIYTKKPVKTSNFEYSHKLNNLDEPNNIIEEIISVINRIKNMFNIIKENA